MLDILFVRCNQVALELHQLGPQHRNKMLLDLDYMVSRNVEDVFILVLIVDKLRYSDGGGLGVIPHGHRDSELQLHVVDAQTLTLSLSNVTVTGHGIH